MTAPLLGILRPETHRFKLGSFEVTTILDGAFLLDNVSPPFCMDQDDEAIEALAAANNLPANRMEHTFTLTIVNTGEQIVLFDVGFGAAKRGDGAGRLLSLIHI